MAANVLTFDASRRRQPKQAGKAGPGDVLVFSGVRYDRPEHGAAETSATAPPTDPLGGGGNPRHRM